MRKAQHRPPVRLGRLQFSQLTLKELLQVPSGELRHVVTVNAEIFVLAHEMACYADLLAKTTNTIDGRVVQWLVAVANKTVPVRLAGADFISDLCRFAEHAGESVFLLGASENANRVACDRLRAQHPRLRLAGYSPPVTDRIDDPQWTADILQRLTAFAPRHLVVCFGPPKQELWIAANAGSLAGAGVRFAAGLGGTIDFVAGAVKRAPRLAQIIGLEWFFRFLVAPRARFRRTLSMFRLPYHAWRGADDARARVDGDD